MMCVSSQSSLHMSQAKYHQMLGKAPFPLLSQERLNKQWTSDCFPAQTESDRTKKNVNMHYLYNRKTLHSYRISRSHGLQHWRHELEVVLTRLKHSLSFTCRVKSAIAVAKRMSNITLIFRLPERTCPFSLS